MFFLIHTFYLLFVLWVGNQYYAFETIHFAMIALAIVSFSIGYITLRFKNSGKPTGCIRFNTKILYYVLIVYMVILVADVLRSGFIYYFSGERLRDGIENYKDNVFDPFKYLYFVLNYSIVACCSLVSINYPKNRISLFGSLIVLPLLTISRGALLSGTVAFLYARKRFFSFTSVAFLLVAFFVLTLFGQMRELSISGTAFPIFDMVVAELSVANSIYIATDFVDKNGLLFGQSNLAPLATQIVPRFIYESKPPMTGFYITEYLSSDLVNSGLYYAPTYVADAYINFGLFGVVFAAFLLGFLSKYLDYSNLTPYAFIIAYYYYDLLRNNLPQAVTAIVLACIMAKFFHFISVRCFKNV